MSKITPIAISVTGNEKAVALMEVHKQSENNRGMRRYQVIYVIRDGKMAEFRRDMGATKNWKGAQQMNIPSLLEHSVDELMAMADELRYETKIDLKDFLELDNMNLV